jgi:hypothetical protein
MPSSPSKQKHRKLDHADLVALIILVTGFSLLAFHIDGTVGAVTTMAAGWWFGKKHAEK